RYERWIGDRRAEAAGLNARYQEAASRHLAECDTAASRMRAGLEYLRSNPLARKAFLLANHAILLQQVATRPTPREVSYDATERRLRFNEPYRAPDATKPPLGRGAWRPFQIAFLLAALQSAGEGDAPDREAV